MHSDYYQPEKLLAAGPSAKVYRGVETHTGRKVLIKALLDDHEATHPLDREQLQLMVPSLMQIRHPQVAGLITLLPSEDEFALVYEFLAGTSVRQFAQEQKINTADLSAVAVQLMHALAAGEHLRLPHGDPKPANLILAALPAGGLFLQVQDWGISLARPQPALETLWFAAPERHQGAAPTSQSDLFTAAASLFYLATGTTAAQGNNSEEVLADWQTFDLRACLSQMRSDLDPGFVDWLQWLLRPDPAQRPASIAQALDMLMRNLHGGYQYQQIMAPQMPPGATTGPMVIGSGAAPQLPHRGSPPAAQSPSGAAAPRAAPPKPPTSSAVGAPPRSASPQVKPRQTTSSAAAPPPATSKISRKALMGVALNLIALGFLGWFFSPSFPSGGEANDPESKNTGANAGGTQEIKGRYIKIAMKGKEPLNLAEVEVFSNGRNVARDGEATQSSDEWGGTASRAIDGNTDGYFDHQSVSHTHGKKANPWWQVDLGSEHTLDSIIIWNRTDKEFSSRLKNFTVQILSAHQSEVWQQKVIDSPSPSVTLKIDP